MNPEGSSRKSKKMTPPNLFSSGPELANLAVNLEPVHHAWSTIVDLNNEANSNNQGPSIKFKATQLPNNLTVLTFATSPIFTSNQELVSSTVFKDSFPHFQFLCSPLNPSFSIDKAVVRLFASAFNELCQLKEQYVKSRPLVITGRALGGSIASLYALWLLQSSDASKTKSPICITFGSPLIGDNSFRKAISECPAWQSSFLHVVSDRDPVFSISHPPEYKPFGTFLFCSESGCTCFCDSDSVSALLELMKSRLGNQELHQVDYGVVLANLKSKVLVKDTSDLDEKMADTLEAGIAMQLQTVGIREDQTFRKSIVDKEKIRTTVFDSPKKLNDRKIHMAQLEWYKKETKKAEIGYYDSYKNGRLPRDIDASKFKMNLTIYWKNMVEEVGKKPQKEGAAFRMGWMFAGTNYRRMVEPLDIADFYKSNSQGNYLESRSKHYELLEEWHKLEENKKDQKYVRKEAISMTDDSCFWAHVEEAIISCRLLNSGDLSNEQRQVRIKSLHDFDGYLMKSIHNFAVSPEVFLKNSSLMKLWVEYEKIIVTHNLAFADYMKKHEYLQYI